MTRARLLLIVMAAAGLILPAPGWCVDRAFARLPRSQPELTPLRAHAPHRRVPVEILLCSPAKPERVRRCSHLAAEPEANPERALAALLADELGVSTDERY